jgi:hypothetical protein
MRHLFLSSLSCLALLVGCATGDDDDSIQGDDDVTQGDDDDTTAGDDDTTAVDDDDDATPTDDDDATPGDDDDTPADDDDTAGDDDDSANACGTVGQACTDPAQCGSGESCFLGGNGGVCAPYRDGCGGFAGATCDDPAAPICLYLNSADYGVCVSAFEKECICTRSPAAIEPGYC